MCKRGKGSLPVEEGRKEFAPGPLDNTYIYTMRGKEKGEQGLLGNSNFYREDGVRKI